MGLLDGLFGSGNASAQPGASAGGSMSPLTKALLMLLAAKAYQHYTSRQPAQQPDTAPNDPRFDPQASQQTRGGGLGDILGGNSGGGGLGGGGLGGGLGGLLSGGLGGILGGLISGGGLSTIVDQLRNAGHGGTVDSWIGRGQNQALDVNQLGDALGSGTIDELSAQTGMPRDRVLSELSQELPQAVDHFTPDGRLPTQAEASSRI